MLGSPSPEAPRLRLRGLSLSLPGQPSQSWSQSIRPRSCFSPEKEGPLSSAPAPGESPLLPASLGKFPHPPPAPAEASTLPWPALCHLGPWGWPSAGSQGTISLKRQLPHVFLQCTHPEHRDAEAESPSLGKGLGCKNRAGAEYGPGSAGSKPSGGAGGESRDSLKFKFNARAGLKP